MSFIAGRYTVTYNNQACGQLDNQQGIVLSWRHFYEEVQGDAWGDVVQDRISQGSQIERLRMTLLEFDAAARAAIMFPLNTTAWGVATPGVPVVAAGKAKDIVLTAIAGTSAYGGTGTGGPNGGSPATITILNCIVAPETIDITLNTRLRKVPVVFVAHPEDNGSGVMVSATQT